MKTIRREYGGFNGENKIVLLSLMLAMSIGLLIRSAFPANLSILTSLVFLLVTIAWTVTLMWRVVSVSIRRCLMCSGICMTLFYLLQIVKYRCFEGYPDVSRYLWYAYYIPLTIIPMVAFLSALCLDNEGQTKSFRIGRLLIIPCIVLILLVLTNDWHHLVFIFPQGTAFSDPPYHYGPGYLFVLAWMFLLLFFTLVLQVQKCRLSLARKKSYIPFCFLLVAVLYVVYVACTGHPHVVLGTVRLLQMQDVCCILLILSMECCLILGLIPCNLSYNRIFTHSSLYAQICDREGKRWFSANKAIPLTKEQQAMVEDGPKLISPHIRLNMKPVLGGKVYWTENLAYVHKLSEELSETASQLSEENILIERENSLKAQKAQLLIQNQMYDSLNKRLAPELTLISGWIKRAETEPEVFRQDMPKAALLGAFVKRKTNLFMYAMRNEPVSYFELYLATKEVLEYVSIMGIKTSIGISGEGMMTGEEAERFFDQVEAFGRSIRVKPVAIMAWLSGKEDSLTLTFTLEERPDAPMNTFPDRFSPVREDNTLYLTIRQETGGLANGLQ